MDYLLAKDYTIDDKHYYGYLSDPISVGRTTDGSYKLTVNNQFIDTDRETLVKINKMIRNLLAKDK